MNSTPRIPNVYIFELLPDQEFGLYFWSHPNGHRTATLTCPMCNVQHFKDPKKPYHTYRSLPQLDSYRYDNKDHTVFVPLKERQQEIDNQVKGLIDMAKKFYSNTDEPNIFVLWKDMADGTVQVETWMTTANIPNKEFWRIFKMKAFW
jgi:hypothetical protein